MKLFCLVLVLVSLSVVHGGCSFALGCGCAWTQNGRNCRGAGDGTPCYQECCCPYKGGGGSSNNNNNNNNNNNQWIPPAPANRPVVPAPSNNNGGGGSSSTGSGPWRTGRTTRYWDSCKASCSWPGKVPSDLLARGPVKSCDARGNRIGSNEQSGCQRGPSYACLDAQPWVENGVLHAFAASNQRCCMCYEMILQSGPSSGKRMLVQVTNSGEDLVNDQFDLQFPGGGVGLFDGATSQFPGTPASAWGARYGGVSTIGACAGLPAPLVAGCKLRFTNLGDNPAVKFRRIACPAALVAKSGCQRTDDP
jgi:hypothetical protein